MSDPLQKPTKQRILDVAQELVQTQGFNAFSYADLSERIDIKTSSIHYHFKTKDVLGVALMQRYREDFAEQLVALDAQDAGAVEKVEQFAGFFVETFADKGRMCLGGMLATDYATLSEALQAEVRAFFTQSEDWLADVIEEGRREGAFRSGASAREVAQSVMSALEGVLLTARALENPARVQQTVRWLLMSLQ